jgi:glutamine amidotransferase
MIAIIDYGMGNLRSVQKGFQKVGCDALVTRDAGAIADALGVVLPGVGSFKMCMENLRAYKLMDPIHGAVESGRPFLGICLGYQLLFTESEEYGPCPGLGLLKGRVVRFSDDVKTPHMGWNRVKIVHRSPILDHLPDGSYLYFVHSYYVVPEDQGIVAATTEYSENFASMIQVKNLFATQFHPEKSQSLGLGILKRFGEICEVE